MCEHNVNGSDNYDYVVHACGNCGNAEFYMVLGGGLVCCACGVRLTAFWIDDDGINTKEVNYAN